MLHCRAMRKRKPHDPASLRKILRDNVRALLAAKQWTIKDAVTYSKANGGHLTNGTMGRAHKGETSIGLDQLAEVAHVFGVEPWVMLQSSGELFDIATDFGELDEEHRLTAKRVLHALRLGGRRTNGGE